MSSIIIDFKDLFDSLSDQPYAVIKLDPKFPSYSPGQDIDIFCRDLEDVSRRIIGFLSAFVGEEFSIAVSKKIDQVHIDLIAGKQIHFRFDLLGALPKHKFFFIKPSLFDVVIESCVEKNIEGVLVKVPNEVDEGVLRYIEYLEYISSRPDKIKHSNWILGKFGANPSSNRQFFLRLHHFLSIPEPVYSKKSYATRLNESFEYFGSIFLKAFDIIKNKGLKAFFAKVFERFFK